MKRGAVLLGLGLGFLIVLLLGRAWVTPQPTGRVSAIQQVAHTATGFDASGEALPVPSPDPAGVAFHPPSGHLFLVDSEVDEEPVFGRVGANLFEVSLDGSTLYRSWDLTLPSAGEPKNTEPTGIAFCGGQFYITNDNRNVVYRYRLDGDSFVAVDWTETTGVPDFDPEDITCDDAGTLYVISGVGHGLQLYHYGPTGVGEGPYFNLADTAGSATGVPSDPEGIAFDPVSGHLFVLSAVDEAIFEYTTDGVFVKTFSIESFSPLPMRAAGLVVGPSSADPALVSFYFADRKTDNDSDHNKNDGALYEALITR